MLDMVFVLWFARSLNGLYVLDHSVTTGSALSDKFPPFLAFVINSTSRILLYLLADGIYPSYRFFVKTIATGGNNWIKKQSAQAQEAIWKAVERAFEILILFLHILQRSIRIMCKDDIETVVNARVILHNMIFELRRDSPGSEMCKMQQLSNPSIAPVTSEGISYYRDSTMERIVKWSVVSWVERIANGEIKELDESEHHSLLVKLIERIHIRSRLLYN